MSTTVTITIGSESTPIPVNNTTVVGVQVIPDGGIVGNYIFDHSLCINRDDEDAHSQYLLKTDASSTYSLNTHDHSQYLLKTEAASTYALNSHNHPEYLLQTSAVLTYAPLTHSNNSTIHFTQEEISITSLQVSDWSASTIAATLYDGSYDTNPFTDEDANRLTSLWLEFGSGTTLSPESVYNAYHQFNEAVYGATQKSNLNTLSSGHNTNLHYHDTDRIRSNHTGTQPPDTVEAPVIEGTLLTNVPSISSIEQLFSHTESAGLMTDITISVSNDNTSITITGSPPPIQFLIRDMNGNLLAGSITDNTVSINDGLNIICIEYNNGSPIFSNKPNPADVDLQTTIPIALIDKYNAYVSVFNVGLDSTDSNAKLRKKLFYTEPFIRQSGAVFNATTSNNKLVLECTAGSFWFGLNSTNSSELFTTSYFNYVHKSGSSWLINPVNNLTDNVNVNKYNSSGNLVNVTNKYYYNYYVYYVFGMGSGSSYFVVHGQAQYASLGLARAAINPSEVPPIIGVTSLLLGVVVMQEGFTNTPADVLTKFTTEQLYSANNTTSTGWKDMLSPLSAVGVPSNTAPDPVILGDSPSGQDDYRALAFALNDFVYCLPFHVNHDIKPNSLAYLHVHWTTNGTSTNAVKWRMTVRRAKGHNQSNFSNVSNLIQVIEVQQAGSGTAWRHMVTEAEVDQGILLTEPDELILVTLRRITNGGTDNTDNVIGLMADLHYQSDRDHTPNKAPNFYV